MVLIIQIARIIRIAQKNLCQNVHPEDKPQAMGKMRVTNLQRAHLTFNHFYWI